MSEEYRFIWGEVKAIEDACSLATILTEKVLFGHLETEDFDLDFDRIGIVVRIPHDRKLNEERE